MKKIILFTFIVVADFVSKFWVSSHIPLIKSYLGYPFGGIGLIHTNFLKISIVHTTNTGTAWGLFSDHLNLLLIFRVLITAGLLVYLIFFKPKKYLQIPLTIICAGAVGNIVSVFQYGHVVDMIYCIIYRYSYPIFNVADSAIFCSIFYLLFHSFTKGERHRATAD
jgi:signal peptidase II